MTRTHLLGAACAAMLATGAASATDLVVLRDGRELHGEFIGATGRSVHLRTADGVERRDLSQVASIRLGPREPSPEPEHAAPHAGDRVIIVGSGPDQSIEQLPAMR